MTGESRANRCPLVNLRNLDGGEMAAALGRFGVAPDVARRVFSAVHRDGASSIEAAQPGIRGLGRAAARAIDASTNWPELKIVERRRSGDGFLKYLFKLSDGPEIEAVRIPLPDPPPSARCAPPGPTVAYRADCRRFPPPNTPSVSARRRGARSPVTSVPPDAWEAFAASKLGKSSPSCAPSRAKLTGPFEARCSWAWESRC